MIDTSVLIAGMSDRVIDEISHYCSSMICRAELAQGLYAFAADASRRSEESQRRELIRVLDSLPSFWAKFDLRASDGYGTLTATPRSAIRLKDALIAGHAMALGIPLITQDKGFSRFPGVATVSPDAIT